jgi:hypothetical protein|tara:strand:- start:201 stop:599 length:399 start_codon:yes stop_codon:yes gene_type:complete
MDDSSKETIPLNQRQDFALCLSCGFPNHNSSLRCTYCNTSLKKPTGLISWFRQTYLVFKWKWELREDSSKNENSIFILSKKIGFLLTGTGLSGFGFYLFVDSLSHDSFSTAIISILLLLYGFFTLKNLFSGK